VADKPQLTRNRFSPLPVRPYRRTRRKHPIRLRGQYGDLLSPLFPQGNPAQRRYPAWPKTYDAGMRVSWRRCSPEIRARWRLTLPGHGHKITLNPEALRALLHRSAVVAALQQRAQDICHAGNGMAEHIGRPDRPAPEYGAGIQNRTEQTRARARVYPVNRQAILDDAKNSALLKSMMMLPVRYHPGHRRGARGHPMEPWLRSFSRRRAGWRSWRDRRSWRSRGSRSRALMSSP
jgi:hypothetical protein